MQNLGDHGFVGQRAGVVEGQPGFNFRPLVRVAVLHITTSYSDSRFRTNPGLVECKGKLNEGLLRLEPALFLTA
jgi:hypothetical protein